MIRVTSRALTELTRLTKVHKNKMIFFGAKGGGCNGFEYVLKPFDEPADHDEFVHFDGLTMVCCGASLHKIMGTEIDFVSDFQGSRFVYENPLATAQCGCGATFST